MYLSAWRTTISARPASDYFDAYEQGQWHAGSYHAGFPGWDPVYADLDLLDSYSNHQPKMLHPQAGHNEYQRAIGVLSATFCTDPSFFTAEKYAAISAAAPPAPLSPSPPFISVSSYSSSFSSSSSNSPGSGKRAGPAASTSFSGLESPRIDQRAMSSPSSPNSPNSPAAPLNLAKERRRAQNRRAQQTRRERRAQRLKHLEDRVKELEAVEEILRAENAEIKEELMRLEGMLKTAQICQQTDRTFGFLDPVAMWDSIQKHPIVVNGEVDVALVCEELRSLASKREDRTLLFNTTQINEVIEQYRSRAEADRLFCYGTASTGLETAGQGSKWW